MYIFFINEEASKLVITIIYVDDIYFISLKYFSLLLELKQKFIFKWKYHNLGKTKELLRVYIDCNHKNQKIFID